MEKKIIYPVNSKMTLELMEKFDEDRNIFYRWQNPTYEIAGEFTQSWGMIFSSEQEARECAEEWGYTEDEMILPGKSCMDTLEHIVSFAAEFSDTDVLLVFRGADTWVTGHDGEYVARFDEPIAVFSMADILDFCKQNEI